MEDLGDYSRRQIKKLVKIFMWKISAWNPINFFYNDWYWEVEIQEDTGYNIIKGYSKKHRTSIKMILEDVPEDDKKIIFTRRQNSPFPELGKLVLFCDLKTFQRNLPVFKKIDRKLRKIHQKTTNDKLKEILREKAEEELQEIREKDELINKFK